MRLEVPAGSASRSCGLQLKPARPCDAEHEGLYSPDPRWHVSRRSASSWGKAGAYGANSRGQASGTRPRSRAVATALSQAVASPPSYCTRAWWLRICLALAPVSWMRAKSPPEAPRGQSRRVRRSPTWKRRACATRAGRRGGYAPH